jgi:hypothetical protein
MHTNSREGHDAGRPDGMDKSPSHERNDENPGYEVQDVNVAGVITFLAGLSGFLLIFFVFCFVMGKAINTGLLKEDGPVDKWHIGTPGHDAARKRQDLTSNAALEQRDYAAMTQSFPTPRLQNDDGNQDISDMHAREDLLLENYSTGSDLPAGSVRIPIERAMELVAQRGLPQPAGGLQSGETQMAGDAQPAISAPLTNGFARTGYELDQMAAREQRLEFSQPEAKR